MLSRALSLATVMLLIGCFAADPAPQAENLDAGKSPCPDFRRHLHGLPQEPAGPVEDSARRVSAGLSASALHDRRPNGLGAQRLPDLQWGDRYAPCPAASPSPAPMPKPGTDAESGTDTKPDETEARWIRPTAGAAAEAGATGRGARRQQNRRGWSAAGSVGRRARPGWPQIGCQAAGAAGRAAKNCPKPIQPRPTPRRPRRVQDRYCQDRYCQDRYFQDGR